MHKNKISCPCGQLIHIKFEVGSEKHQFKSRYHCSSVTNIDWVTLEINMLYGRLSFSEQKS